MSDEQPPRAHHLMTKAEAAAYLRVSVRTFERVALKGLVASGRCIQVGGRRRFTQEDLDAWLDEHRPVVTAPPRAPARPKKVAMSPAPKLTGRAAEYLERLRRPRRPNAIKLTEAERLARLQKRRRFTKEELDAWLEEQRRRKRV